MKPSLPSLLPETVDVFSRLTGCGRPALPGRVLSFALDLVAASFFSFPLLCAWSLRQYPPSDFPRSSQKSVKVGEAAVKRQRHPFALSPSDVWLTFLHRSSSPICCRVQFPPVRAPPSSTKPIVLCDHRSPVPHTHRREPGWAVEVAVRAARHPATNR